RLLDEAREQLKAHPDMRTLSDDERQAVLRPLNTAKTETTEEAVYPSLAELGDGFARRLADAKREAEAKLDSLVSKTSGELVVRVSLELRDREIRSAADVDTLLDEIRMQLLEQLERGEKVRL